MINNHYLGKKDTFTHYLCTMVQYENINKYYPVSSVPEEHQMEDFTILKLEDVTHGIGAHNKDVFSQPHLRNFFEIAVAVKESNSASVSIGNNQFLSQKNEIVFISPYQHFSIAFNPNKKIQIDEGFIIVFKPSFLLNKKRNFEVIHAFRYFNTHTFPQYILPSEQLNSILQISKVMYKEFTHPQSYSKEILQANLEVLLQHCNRLIQISPQFIQASPCETITAQFEQKIIQDQNHISTISDYANQLNISPNYLSECVKKSTGKTAKSVLLSHKVVVAKSLLQQSDLSVAEIAEEMRFTEPTNFTKFFKNNTGMTPKAFRSKA